MMRHAKPDKLKNEKRHEVSRRRIVRYEPMAARYLTRSELLHAQNVGIVHEVVE